MNIGRRRVQTQFDAQRNTGTLTVRQLLRKLRLDQQFVATAPGDSQGVLHCGRQNGWRGLIFLGWHDCLLQKYFYSKNVGNEKPFVIIVRTLKGARLQEAPNTSNDKSWILS